MAAPLIGVGRCRLFASEPHTYSVRAIDLVQQSNVIDMLSLLTLDWPLLDRWRQNPDKFGETDFRALRSSGIDVFHPAVAFDSADFELTRQWMNHWNQFIARKHQYFLRIDSAADLMRARTTGKIGIVLGMQDANYIRSLQDVESLYGIGQRLMQLTYNSTNRLGHGCMVADDGLSPFGLEVIRKMNDIGMAVDLSHCGERTTLEAIEASTRPVLITHSNCRALAPSVSRCKSDEIIAAAASKGGVIGLTNVRHFVRAADPVTIEDVLDHFDHAIQLAGIEHVGVGSDLDLRGRDATTHSLKYDIAGLNHPRRMYDLVDGLIRRGYTDSHIELILGGNFHRALSQIWV
jgi:membrane dipeptidase